MSRKRPNNLEIESLILLLLFFLFCVLFKILKLNKLVTKCASSLAALTSMHWKLSMAKTRHRLGLRWVHLIFLFIYHFFTSQPVLSCQFGNTEKSLALFFEIRGLFDHFACWKCTFLINVCYIKCMLKLSWNTNVLKAKFAWGTPSQNRTAIIVTRHALK